MYLQTIEPDEALLEMAAMCNGKKWKMVSWDFVRGLNSNGFEIDAAVTATAGDFLAVLTAIPALVNTEGIARDEFLQRLLTRARLRELADELTLKLRVLTCFRRSPPDHERFAKRLERHATEFFTFLRLPNVEATNYRAEQAIRPSVVNRKVWGGNRTDNGAQHQSILTSVLLTCDQLVRDPLDFLANARQATQSIPLLALTRQTITFRLEPVRRSMAQPQNEWPISS